MRLLILGGSGFLGRHLTERALARGWDVTHFNRGQRNPGLYPAVTELHGDRKRSLDALAGHSFDSVVDTSGFLPRDVERSARFLKDHVPQYVFVSSISAYADHSSPIDEQSALIPWDSEFDDAEDVEPATYGMMKAESERRAQGVYGEGALIIRPGLIVGRYDPTGRFSYWPQRFRRGGSIVVPKSLEVRVQFIDAQDLANWTLDLCAKQHGGIYNAVGPRDPMTLGDLFQTLMPLAPEGTELVPLGNEFLSQHGVAPWTGLPLWLPRDAQADGMMKVDLTRALAAGLAHRPLKDTVADILSEIDETGTFAAGASLTEEQERALLAAR